MTRENDGDGNVSRQGRDSAQRGGGGGAEEEDGAEEGARQQHANQLGGGEGTSACDKNRKEVPPNSHLRGGHNTLLLGAIVLIGMKYEL